MLSIVLLIFNSLVHLVIILPLLRYSGLTNLINLICCIYHQAQNRKVWGTARMWWENEWIYHIKCNNSSATFSLYLFIALIPHSPWECTPMAKEPPLVSIQTLPPCLFSSLLPSSSTSLTCTPILCPSIFQVAFLYYLDPHFCSHTLSSSTPHSSSSQYVQTSCIMKLFIALSHAGDDFGCIMDQLLQ